MSKKEIKDFSKKLKIPYLVHFSHISNLEGIIEKGILSRKQVDLIEGEIKINDIERYDGRENTVSLSIAHPNDRMFYKYRENDEDWCVIALDPKLIWEQECLFTRYNAARDEISSLLNDELATVESFKAMFDELDGYDSRKEQCLKDFDPTDKEAEILVIDHVPTEYILGVFVSNRQVKKSYNSLIGEKRIKIHRPDKGVYASRLYRRKWQ